MKSYSTPGLPVVGPVISGILGELFRELATVEIPPKINSVQIKIPTIFFFISIPP